MRQGAERGYPEWLHAFASHLAYTEKNHKEALAGAEGCGGRTPVELAYCRGYLLGWQGGGEKSALCACYEKTASYGNASYACRQLGIMYFHGYGTAVDYAGAVQWLEKDKEPEYLGMICWGFAICWGMAANRTRQREKHY